MNAPEAWREHYACVVRDIADSYVCDPDVRKEMVKDLLTNLDDSMITERVRLVPDPGQAPDVAALLPVPLGKALDYFRWCWDCGSRASDCDTAREQGRKCCPDCRHRDTNAVYLAELLYGRAMRRDHPNAQRGRTWDLTVLQRHQLVDWTARLARLSWSGDEQAHAAAQGIARELKAAADSATRALLGTDTTREASR